MSLDQGQLEVQVEKAAQACEDAKSALWHQYLKDEETERAWLLLCAQETEAIEQEFEGKRLPGEDVRRARILSKHGDSETYINYRIEKAKLSAMEIGERLTRQRCTALQSLLKVHV